MDTPAKRRLSSTPPRETKSKKTRIEPAVYFSTRISTKDQPTSPATLCEIDPTSQTLFDAEWCGRSCSKQLNRTECCCREIENRGDHLDNKEYYDNSVLEALAQERRDRIVSRQDLEAIDYYHEINSQLRSLHLSAHHSL